MMKFSFFWLLVTVLLTTDPTAHAQQPGKIPRIGYLTTTSLSSIARRVDVLRQGLRELGYIEGKNIVIEWRAADGQRDRIAELAAELVRLKVEVIVTGGQGATRPVMAATSTIPIVMAQDNDPVANGFVANLAHPGGNVTGLSRLRPELSGKRLELLKKIIPQLNRVAFFGDAATAANAQVLKETKLAAAALKLQLQVLNILEAKDIDSAFRAAVKARAEAVLENISGTVGASRSTQIIEGAVKSRLPAMHERSEEMEAGGLMSYGASFSDLDRRAATYVDKILKGRKPSDLPVEQPKKFEFIVNLKAAKAIGLTIPPNVLVRADRVIR